MSLSVEDLERDPFMKPFTDEEFDVSSHVTALLNSSTPSLSILSSSIASVDQQIHLNVTTHHGDLLAQTSNMELMESVTDSCSTRAQVCLDAIGKMKSKLETLYKSTNSHVDYLENLYKANEAMRRLSKVVELDKRSENEKNLGEVASCVVQIEWFCSRTPKLQALQPYFEKATGLRQNIEKQTENMLNQALNAAVATQVSSSLQIFINLNVLEVKISKVFGEIEKIIERDVKMSLDIKLQSAAPGKSGPGRVMSSTSNPTAAQIWPNLESLANKITIQTAKVKLIWAAILQGKDSKSNLPYIDFLDNSEKDFVFKKFWSNFISILSRHFSSILEYIKTVLENEYPRLLKIICGIAAKIEEGSVEISIQQRLRDAISSFEKAYLSKSVARLFESVNHTFATLPTNKEMDKILTIIKSELQVEDVQLKKLITRNISKTIHLVCVRAESLVRNDGDATQVIGPATDSQVSNAKLVNALDYFRIELKTLDILSETEKTEIGSGIEILMRNTINPLIGAISDSIEAIILTIHHENFKRTNKATEYSLYMGELASFVARGVKDYLSLYKSNDLIQKCGLTLASRAIDLWTRHTSLLTAMNLESVRTQILSDGNHLEIALTPVCPLLSELGRNYKVLKGYKSLIASTTNNGQSAEAIMETIAGNSLVGNVVNWSLTLHLLFMFAPKDLKPPHTANGWSLTRYSKWLDSHPSEAERLNLIKVCLESYVHNVTAIGRTEFAKVYVHLLSILQKGIAAN